MARVTVEDCLDHVDNRFDLVRRATRRARQLEPHRDGERIVPPCVEEEDDKTTVIALREIAEGLVTDELLAEGDAMIQQVEEDEAAEAGPFGYGDDRDDDL